MIWHCKCKSCGPDITYPKRTGAGRPLGRTLEADLPPELLAIAKEIEKQLLTNPTDEDLLAIAEDAAYHKMDLEREARWEEDMKILQLAVEWEFREEEDRARQRALDKQEDE